MYHKTIYKHYDCAVALLIYKNKNISIKAFLGKYLCMGLFDMKNFCLCREFHRFVRYMADIFELRCNPCDVKYIFVSENTGLHTKFNYY